MSVSTVPSGGAALHVVEAGDPDAPTLVFVHGYPDTHRCWDEVIGLLCERFHCVTYDVRGMGRSAAAGVPGEYALDALARDLGAVIEAVSPKRPVHLVGHDWGAFQCWEAVTGGALDGRIASFTAVAGPRIDGVRGWVRRRLRPSVADLVALAGQARRSWYVAAFQVPAIPERVVGPAIGRVWAPSLQRLEGISPREGHPADTLASDARAGLALYRTNMRGRSRLAERPPARVPVQLIVAARDRYISPRLYDDADRWADNVWRREVDAGHWVQRSHPAEVAGWVTEFVSFVDGRVAESEALRRARLYRRPDVAQVDLSSLSGKRVLITGAARGIGAALAEKLAGCGARLALVGLEPDALAAVAERCGAGTFVGECDVSRFEPLRAAVDAAAEALGGLDIVVANAGIAAGGPLRSQDIRSWERVIEINLLGVMYTDRAALPHLERSRGYVLNIASTAAALRSPGLSAYCAAKAGVEALSDCLRIEMAPLGVDVGVAYFLFLDTDMVRDAEREMPLLERAKADVPNVFSRTYPLAPAIDEVVAAIAERRRRVTYPKWFLRILPLRQLFVAPFVERRAAKGATEALAEYDRMVTEKGAAGASATERTRELAGL